MDALATWPRPGVSLVALRPKVLRSKLPVPLAIWKKTEHTLSREAGLDFFRLPQRTRGAIEKFDVSFFLRVIETGVRGFVTIESVLESHTGHVIE